MYGKTHSEKSKLKMSLVTKGNKSFNYGKVKVNDLQVIEIREKYTTGK